jgi:glycosyltransferase involved in cell wall biosynthesis
MSHDMARQIARLGCPEEKLRVIHRGIRLSRFPFAPRRAPDSGPASILTVGRLMPKKGPDDLARAFTLLCRRHPNVVLRVVGEGKMQPEMEMILSEAGVRDQVQFLGYLAPNEVAEEMQRAHLFCLPCRVGPDGDSEGIPNALKEAMATGLPVVSTYHAGIPELVEDGVSGYLVPERDVEAIADRLACLLEEPERWEAMGQAGRAKVEVEFSLDSVVQQLEVEVYTPLLGRPGSHTECASPRSRPVTQGAARPHPTEGTAVQVSIVIPAYNAPVYLSQTLDSILAQTLTKWEGVIVDDGSTDETGAIADRYARLDPRLRVVHQTNRGVAAARNRGFAETRADVPYVIFLDQDDLWEQDALLRLIQTLEDYREAVAAHGLSRFIDEQAEPCSPGELEVWGRHRLGVVGKRLLPWPPEAPTTLAVLAYRNCIATIGQTLIRRSALEVVGAFDPVTTPCEDWDLTLRLSKLGPLAYLDRVVLNKRKHGASQSRQRDRVFEAARLVRGKLLAAEAMSEEQRRTVLMATSHWNRYLCAERLERARYSLAHGQLRQAALLLRRYVDGHVQRLRRLPA